MKDKEKRYERDEYRCDNEFEHFDSQVDNDLDGEERHVQDKDDRLRLRRERRRGKQNRWAA